MILLQSQMTDAIEKTFAVDPTNVFGILAGLLTIYAVYMTLQNSGKDKEIKQMLKDMIAFTNQTTNQFENLIDQVRRLEQEIKEIKR